MEKVIAVGKYTLIRDDINESSDIAKFNVILENGWEATVIIDYQTNKI